LVLRGPCCDCCFSFVLICFGLLGSPRLNLPGLLATGILSFTLGMPHVGWCSSVRFSSLQLFRQLVRSSISFAVLSVFHLVMLMVRVRFRSSALFSLCLLLNDIRHPELIFISLSFSFFLSVTLSHLSVLSLAPAKFPRGLSIVQRYLQPTLFLVLLLMIPAVAIAVFLVCCHHFLHAIFVYLSVV